MKQETAIRALQSRKAKRANHITTVERRRVVLDATIKMYKDLQIDIEQLKPAYAERRRLRSSLKLLADDQKLDNSLLKGLVYAQRIRVLVVHDFQPLKNTKKHPKRVEA